MANIVAGRVDPLSSVVVFDSKIWDGPGRANRVPANPQLERGGATLHTANTIQELAAAAGLPAESLEKTVTDYNDAVRSNAFAKLDPARTTKRYAASPIEVPPFFAIPMCAGITYTMGGIKIDGEARVMDRNGRAIEGLYAAGTTTGGLEGGERARYVGGLSRAGVFGMKAAQHIARRVAATKT
jgi:fumarate reductase flavoprotein subunit